MAEARRRKRGRGRRRRPPAGWRGPARHALEAAALTAVGLVIAVTGLGRAADRFAGTGVWASLVPFAGATLGLGLAVGGLLQGWLYARRGLAERGPAWPVVAAALLAVGAGWWASRPAFHADLARLRTAVGGTAQAERVAIAHQVYAAYRRADRHALAGMFERARPFEPTIHEAAAAFAVDAEVLMGVGAAESSFRPRTSADGGRGVFQITAAPSPVVDDVRRRLGVREPDPNDARHAAWLAAATLRRYLDEMRGDLFLGLLAYNIGPRNGGLRSIMGQYGARDFVTIQPYLQLLPRDYPIRVLTSALAYRLWRRDADLPAYEIGDNALRIQRVGVPGLDD